MSQKIALLDRFIFFQLYKWGYVKGCIKSEKLYLEMFRLKWHHVVFFFRPENVKRLYIKDVEDRVLLIVILPSLQPPYPFLRILHIGVPF
jgi:hypothetical protein